MNKALALILLTLCLCPAVFALKAGDPAPAVQAETWLNGDPVNPAESDGETIYVVEFWATWCPPCRGTLAWLGQLQQRHPQDVVVLAAAIESEEADVRRIRDELGLPLRFGMGSPDMARAFGDLSAVPTLFVFDRQGRTRGAFYGAPPSLHAEAEQALAAALD